MAWLFREKEHMKDEDDAQVARFDRGSKITAVRLDNGFLRVSATVGRVGVLTYKQADGSERREFRPAEEVFHPDSLDTLKMVPVTLNHPPRSADGGLVTAQNAADFAVGSSGEQAEQVDEDKIGMNLMITHDRAITAIDSGVGEISPGYMTTLEYTPGVWNGIPYDAIQRNIRYNHLAIVERGRQGPSVRLHLDTDAVEVGGQLQQKESTMSDLVKINLDGVDFEVSEQVQQALEAREAKAAEELNAVKDELSKASARADSAAAELDEVKAAYQSLKEEAPKLAKEAAEARIGLERTAATVLGEADLSEKSEREIKVAVIEKVSPAVAARLDEKDDVYLEASFEACLELHKDRPNEALAAVRKDTEKTSVKQDKADPAEEYAEALRNAWRK